MNKKKETGIIILVIAIILIGIALIMVFNDKGNKQKIPSEPTVVEEPEIISSDLLNETHTYNGVSFIDLVVHDYERRNDLSVQIKNETTSTTKEMLLIIVVLDSNSNEITRIPCYVDELKPGEDTFTELSSSVDLSKIHDYKIIAAE